MTAGSPTGYLGMGGDEGADQTKSEIGVCT